MEQILTSTTENWCVYIIICNDNSLYTGITNNLSRRFKQHSQGCGAKYFRSRQPVKVVFVEYGHDRCSAAKREYAIKQLKPKEKAVLIAASKCVVEINST